MYINNDKVKKIYIYTYMVVCLEEALSWAKAVAEG